MDLVTLAEQAAAAADLDDQSRARMDAELEFGTDEFAIMQAVLETRAPLPPAILDQIAQWVDSWDLSPDDTYRRLVIDGIAKQQAANAA